MLSLYAHDTICSIYIDRRGKRGKGKGGEWAPPLVTQTDLRVQLHQVIEWFCLNAACIVYSCFAAAGARVGRKYSEWCMCMSTRCRRHFKALTIVRINVYASTRSDECESAGRLSEYYYVIRMGS